MLGILVNPMLIVRGGVTISMVMMTVSFFQGLVWGDFGDAEAHVFRSAW